jgi:regulator of cell morphogenesis and NO signaling
MLLDATKTVREFAIESPNATRIFEELKIDYCCGGNRPLKEVCARNGLEVDEVLKLLSNSKTSEIESQTSDAQSLPLTQLIHLIVEKHHVFTRNELKRLTALLEKVCSVHGENHPELVNIQSKFQILQAELEPHMMKEERILFPYIKGLETAVTEKGAMPFAPFGQVRNPIAAMMREHEAAGEILKTIRKLSNDFVIPEDSCLSYSTLYNALQELEADLHQHIHLENNILFPRSLELEEKALS